MALVILHVDQMESRRQAMFPGTGAARGLGCAQAMVAQKPLRQMN